MVKATRGQEVKAKIRRQEREEMKRVKDSMFPNCIGMFPDECEGVTNLKIKDGCERCPYYSRVRHMEEIKEEIKVSSKRKMSEEEYDAYLKQRLSEEDYNRWKKAHSRTDKEKREEAVERKKPVQQIVKKKGIANVIREHAVKGDLDEDKIYEDLKESFTDRDEKYLRMRISTTIDYLKKRGEIK